MKLQPFDRIANELYETVSRANNTQPRRSYLGMSSIGDSCKRKLWYSFRGYTPIPLDGKVLMIFRFGNLIESEVIAWLKMAGYRIDGTGDKQIEFSDYDGYFKGHADGILYGVTSQPHILEIKSCNANRFKLFKQYGVQKTQSLYFYQVQLYMGYANLERALFVIQCKDNSEIYTERVYFDAETFEALRDKAYRIITANDPPPQPFVEDSQVCGWCDHRITCWIPEDSIQTLRDCMTCEYMRWTGLVRSCLHTDHPYEIKQRLGVCPDWTEKIFNE